MSPGCVRVRTTEVRGPVTLALSVKNSGPSGGTGARVSTIRMRIDYPDILDSSETLHPGTYERLHVIAA